MAQQPDPGVYVEEMPSSSHVIAGVSTSDTAFVDIFRRGPANRAVRISSFGEFTATFGGLASWSRASYGLYQFFLNGGATAWVVRVAPAKTVSATAKLTDLTLEAIGPGTWGNGLQAAEQPNATEDRSGQPTFDLVVRELVTNPSSGTRSVAASEVYRALSLTPGDPQFVTDVVAQDSALVAVADPAALEAPPSATAPPGGVDITSGEAIHDTSESSPFAAGQFAGGTDVTTVTAAELVGASAGEHVPATGIYPLAEIAPFVFNLMCLPATALMGESAFEEVFSAAFVFCEQQRAFLIVDTPQAWDSAAPVQQLEDVKRFHEKYLTNRTDHAAVYFPRLAMPDPGANARPTPTECSGTLAGIYARTDADRGVWKAPAGTMATLTGARPAFEMDDSDGGSLNEMGINALRTFPTIGSVSWGARTLRGADALDSEWKYVPVRRLALFMEQSLLQGTTWAVFEPNDEELWAALRQSVGGFMADLYRKGAFVGRTAKEAYFVTCDASTTTEEDREEGIVNVLVGFAPLYPAEFVVLHISQNAMR